mgnify:CR=1 FL=1
MINFFLINNKLNKKFDSTSWKNDFESRHMYVKDLIDSEILINKLKLDVEAFLGDEFNDYYSNKWSYYIGKRFFFLKIQFA